MFMTFHLLKSASRIFLYSLFYVPSHLAWHVGKTLTPNWIAARIFPHEEVSFAKFLFLSSWFAK
jgi:hypothetical protein